MAARRPRLTEKRLEGLKELDSLLDVMEGAGWEGTPYECRRGDDCQPCMNCENCTCRDKLEAGVQWLSELIHYQEVRKTET